MRDLEGILNKLVFINDSVRSLADRVSNIELENQSSRSTSNQNTTEHNGGPDNTASDAGVGLTPTDLAQLLATSPYDNTLGASSGADIQREFDHVRDSLTRVSIPKKCKVNDSAKGIGKDSKASLGVVSKCPRYAETGLKAIASLQPEREDEQTITLLKDEIQKLYTIFLAQVNFLQAEYANLVVKSTFDDETSRIFRSFENNTGAFTDRSLRNIRLAAELASHRSQPARGRARGTPITFRGTGRGFRGFQHRGDYRGGFPSRPTSPEFHQHTDDQ